jgi:hypothetical protein
MLLLSQGCRIFQSLQIFRVYFSDVERAVLGQVASVTSFMKAISVFKKYSVRIPTQRSRIPRNRPNDVLFPSGRSSVSNIRPNDEKLRTTQDCIRPDVMANRPEAIKSSRRIQCSSAFIRTTWQYRPVAIQSSTSNRVFVLDTDMGRQLQTVWTMWCSRPDAILGKESHTAEV